MATLYWCPHQVFKIHISITSLAKTINALFMSLGDIWACICIEKDDNVEANNQRNQTLLSKIFHTQGLQHF